MNQQYWRDFWDKHISEADNNYRATGRGSSPEIEFFWTVHHVATTLGLRNDDFLLDVGCGTGIMSFLLSPFVDQIDAIDISEVAIAKARENLFGTRNVSFAVASITNLPDHTADNDVDKVLAYSVLQYLDNLDDVKKAFSEVYRVLKPGGKALFSANPTQGYQEEFAVRTGCKNLDVNLKTIWFEPSSLYEMARNVGFESAQIIKIPDRIWQSFYMFDLLVEK